MESETATQPSQSAVFKQVTCHCVFQNLWSSQRLGSCQERAAPTMVTPTVIFLSIVLFNSQILESLKYSAIEIKLPIFFISGYL